MTATETLPPRSRKSPAAFRTISEVASEIRVPAHVLRFWESKFTQIKPMKRGGNRRFYRPEDVKLLRSICRLLYDDGYTIRGVQKLLKSGALPLYEEARASAAESARPSDAQSLTKPAPAAAPEQARAATSSLAADDRIALREALRELLTLRDMLAQAARL
jgi:DNA-binding transcriptional MerR regulator